MPKVAITAQDMISGMTPTLRSEKYVFISTEDPTLVSSLSSQAISIFEEEEGKSLLIPVDLAKESGFSVAQPMSCITLNVYSSLDGVGLTAAVATALGENSIPCNMIAAFHHDHVFVPSEMSDQAMEVLTTLQKHASNK